MRRLRKFVRFSPSERRLLLRAIGAVAGVRVLLWLLPLQRLRTLIERTSRASRHALAASPEEIVWAVTAAAHYIPRATCLTQALSALWLLQRTGGSGLLRLGVARGEDGAIKAHAWLESGGRVMIGGGQLEEYIALPPLPSSGRS